MTALAQAAAEAPASPGVYFLLGARRRLLYIGKAANLRRRLQEHARGTVAGGRRLSGVYRRVREVCWEPQPSDDDAAAREADLIVALQPSANASYVWEGCWNYVVVAPRRDGGLELLLSPEPGEGAEARSYGCFPHLGRGVSSRPGTACSDGYTALLRLLWAASGEGRHVPARITRAAPAEAFVTRVDAAHRAALEAFLSGEDESLLDALAHAAECREPYMHPALARDRVAAEGFFAHGPAALRRLALRHAQPSGALDRDTIAALLASEVRALIGDFQT